MKEQLYICEKTHKCKLDYCMCYRPHKWDKCTCKDFMCAIVGERVKCIPVKEKEWDE